MPKETFFNLPHEKQQRIIKAAIDEFSERHYSQVSINGIIKQADIPKGSFYQYFENKDDVYIHLFTQVSDSKMELFKSLWKEIPRLTFKEYMMHYIGELKKLGASDDQMAKLKHEFLNECPQEIKKQILKTEMPKSINTFKKVIEAYVEKGEFQKGLDANVAAYITVMSISSLEHFDYSQGDDALSALVKIVDFLVNGMS